MLAMFATMASLYVAGRLWQDSEYRVHLTKELDKRSGQGHSIITVDDTLKLLGCREQSKRLSALEMELAAAKHEGFVPKHLTASNGANGKKRLVAVIGILTGLDRKNRDAVRKAWLPKGEALKKLEHDKGILVRFIIGRSANRGDSIDRSIDKENANTDDLIILENHVEGSEEQPKKTKRFFTYAADTWDAEFYVKVNDNINVNIDALEVLLKSHMDKPRVYMGCMKSGEVFSDPNNRWYEPESWKFGDNKSYFRHASGEMFVISRALAQFISINRSILRTYAHDDVSVGSWMIGLNAKYVDEGKLCCSSWPSGSLCSTL